MERLGVLIVLTVLAVVVSLLLRRRRPEAPSAPSYRAPGQVDLADFGSANGTETKLVVVFSSTTCDGCAQVWKTVGGLASADVRVQRVEVQDNAELHKRYKIDGVPTTLIIGTEGIVERSFFGPISEPDLLAHLGE